jgi:hypothetical protein
MPLASSSKENSINNNVYEAMQEALSEIFNIVQYQPTSGL